MPKTAKKSKKVNKEKRPKKPLKKLSKKDLLLLEEYKQGLEDLIRRGRGRGFVTDAEVLNYFPEIEKNLTFLEEVYNRLEKEGIKVRETSSLIKDTKVEEISAQELKDATRI